jgi:hypothetical protein
MLETHDLPVITHFCQQFSAPLHEVTDSSQRSTWPWFSHCYVRRTGLNVDNVSSLPSALRLFLCRIFPIHPYFLVCLLVLLFLFVSDSSSQFSFDVSRGFNSQ